MGTHYNRQNMSTPCSPVTVNDEFKFNHRKCKVIKINESSFDYEFINPALKNNKTNTAIALYAMLAVVFFGGCTEKESMTINEKSNNRIKLIEERIINGYRYSILEVDSVEYLTQDKGGFVRLGK